LFYGRVPIWMENRSYGPLPMSEALAEWTIAGGNGAPKADTGCRPASNPSADDQGGVILGKSWGANGQFETALDLIKDRSVRRAVADLTSSPYLVLPFVSRNSTLSEAIPPRFFFGWLVHGHSH